LAEKGIKPSYTRIRIYETLKRFYGQHPSADDIYHALIPELPTLSKTTVYNTLKLFEKAGLARVLNDENEARFDINASDHGHFKCHSCGMIFDFSIEAEKIEYSGLANFIITEKSVYFKGICSECRENKNFNNVEGGSDL